MAPNGMIDAFNPPHPLRCFLGGMCPRITLKKLDGDYDKLRWGHFRVIGIGHVVLLQRHLVDKTKGGFWVEGKFKDSVSSIGSDSP